MLSALFLLIWEVPSKSKATAELWTLNGHVFRAKLLTSHSFRQLLLSAHHILFTALLSTYEIRDITSTVSTKVHVPERTNAPNEWARMEKNQWNWQGRPNTHGNINVGQAMERSTRAWWLEFCTIVPLPVSSSGQSKFNYAHSGGKRPLQVYWQKPYCLTSFLSCPHRVIIYLMTLSFSWSHILFIPLC